MAALIKLAKLTKDTPSWTLFGKLFYFILFLFTISFAEKNFQLKKNEFAFNRKKQGSLLKCEYIETVVPTYQTCSTEYDRLYNVRKMQLKRCKLDVFTFITTFGKFLFWWQLYHFLLLHLSTSLWKPVFKFPLCQLRENLSLYFNGFNTKTSVWLNRFFKEWRLNRIKLLMCG